MTPFFILLCFGSIVLFLLHIFLYNEYIQKQKNVKKKIFLDESEKINIEENLKKKENFFDLELLSNKEQQKVGILFGYDYNIIFTSLKNSEKCNDFSMFLENYLHFNKTYIFQNNYKEDSYVLLKNILESIEETTIVSLHKTTIFLFFFTLTTCVKLKNNTFQKAICIGNDIILENDLKIYLKKFKKINIICGFECINDTFSMELTVQLKKKEQNKNCNFIIEKDTDISFTKHGLQMIPIPIAYEQKGQPLQIKFLENFQNSLNNVESNLQSILQNIEYNYEIEKEFSYNIFLISVSHINLSSIIKAYFTFLNISNIDLYSFVQFLKEQNVIQFFSYFPRQKINLF